MATCRRSSVPPYTAAFIATTLYSKSTTNKSFWFQYTVAITFPIDDRTLNFLVHERAGCSYFMLTRFDSGALWSPHASSLVTLPSRQSRPWMVYCDRARRTCCAHMCNSTIILDSCSTWKTQIMRQLVHSQLFILQNRTLKVRFFLCRTFFRGSTTPRYFTDCHSPGLKSSNTILSHAAPSTGDEFPHLAPHPRSEIVSQHNCLAHCFSRSSIFNWQMASRWCCTVLAPGMDLPVEEYEKKYCNKAH